MKTTMKIVLAAVIALLLALALAQGTPSVDGARVYLIAPADGATVTSPFLVQFGLAGMGIAPAGVQAEATGHHHLLVDVDPRDLDLSQPLPATDNVRHFGKGQTETMLELPPGEHTLRLLLGDFGHVPHVPPLMSDAVTVTVTQ